MTEQDRQRAIQDKLARLKTTVRAAPIPTGYPQLDGLLLRGRITEIFGGPGCGKTTLAIRMVAAAQGAGLSAAWIDAEQSFDPKYAASLGVALEGFPVARLDTAEDALEIARQLAASGAVDLLVIDSAAALVPRLELETALGESGPGLQSRVLASGIRRLASVTSRTETAILVLNQIRGRGDSEGETTAGGPALKQYAAIRIALEAAGQGFARFRIVKNKATERSGGGELCVKCL